MCWAGEGRRRRSGATVTIVTGSGGGGASVPTAALLERGRGPGLWVVTPRTDQVQFTPVQVLRLGEERSIVAGESAARNAGGGTRRSPAPARPAGAPAGGTVLT
jgi:hypothetical protein